MADRQKHRNRIQQVRKARQIDGIEKTRHTDRHTDRKEKHTKRKLTEILK